MLRRYGPPLLVALLILSTGVAFAVTEHLKLEPSPIRHTAVTKWFSPTCGCSTDRASIAFDLRHGDRVTVTIFDSHDRQVALLLSGVSRPAGRLTVIWRGRTDAGFIVPNGAYHVRVHLASERRTIQLPNVIHLSISPPKITLVSAEPRAISPDGDHRGDIVHIYFKLGQGARALLYVDGRLVTKARLSTRKIDWHGREMAAGRLQLRLGVHRLTLRAVDRAGNVSKPTEPVAIDVRFLQLRPTRIDTTAGASFSVAVSTDRALVHWRFAGMEGQTRLKRLFLQAPSVPGQYWLLVRSGSYGAGARVFVS